MRRKSLLIVGAVTAVAIAHLAAPDAVAQSAGKSVAGGAITGGALTWGVTTEPSCFDPHRSSQQAAFFVARNYVDSLIGKRADGTFAPWLAKAWTVSPDGLTYGFTLREDVSFHDGERFDAATGEIVGIVGESGSGKSTCARIVLGLLAPDEGEVRLSGRPWSGIPERKRRPLRPSLQYVPQDALASFDPRFRVRDLIAENLPGRAADGRDRIAALLAQVGLGADLMPRDPRSLSGGQRQRVAIARALAAEPRLIVCDEPVSALDVSVQAQVLELLGELRDRLGTAMLFISHDLGVVRHLADRVLVFRAGRIVEAGATADLFAAPRADYTKELISSIPSIERGLGRFVDRAPLPFGAHVP